MIITVELFGHEYEIHFEAKITSPGFPSGYDDPGGPIEWKIEGEPTLHRLEWPLPPSANGPSMTDIKEGKHRSLPGPGPALDIPDWMQAAIATYLVEDCDDDICEQLEDEQATEDAFGYAEGE